MDPRSNAKNPHNPAKRSAQDNQSNPFNPNHQPAKASPPRSETRMPAKATDDSVLALATAAAGPPPNELTERLRKLRDALMTGLVERDVAIRLALLAALAGEHLLMVGPPGTAKSMVARRLHLAFREASYFERLLTRFTVPEELFGPLSIKGLEEDRYERLTDRYLPTASIAFLDEIFKANSAILNALLTLLNEREFDNGSKRDHTPLISVVGASNELGEGEELDALFDRFLLRLHVGPVSRGAFLKLIGLRGHVSATVPAALTLTADDLRAVQTAADAVDVPDDVQVLLLDLRDWATAEDIAVSDRRWRKVVKLLQVAAWTNGRKKVSIWDCWLLQHCLWDTPEEREKVYDWYAARVGTSAAMDPSRLTKIVVSWEAKLKADQDSRTQAKDAEGRGLFKKVDGKSTTEEKGRVYALRDGKEQLYLSPATAWNSLNQQLKERTNAGKGYTVAELDVLNLQNPNHYGTQRFQHWANRDAYLADRSNSLVVDAVWPALLEPTRQKHVYVEACAREVEQLKSDVSAYKGQLLRHVEEMERDIRTHLWVTPDFVQPAATTLKQTRSEVDTLLARVEKLKKGFELLPREDGEQPPAPKPAKKK